jgi:tetratricopeptide (TPR) repeat protein
METLRRALDHAGHGRGQLVALVGEAGVGKSRMVWELIHSDQARGWRVLTASAASYGQDMVDFVAIKLLRSHFGIEDTDDALTIRERVASRVGALDPNLRAAIEPVLALLDALPADTVFSRLEAPERRRRALESIQAILLGESRVHPLLLVLEDLHWIDGGSRALLDSLVGLLPAAQLLLVVTFRPEYEHGWRDSSSYTQIDIDPLPSELAGELLHALLGEDPDLQSLKGLLIERCEGNPFFLEESVRALVEEEVLSGAPGAYRLARPVNSVRVPASVQAVLAARIDRLSREDKELLQSAAVIGRELPYALLHAIAERPDEQLRRGLARLRAGEFVYEIVYETDLFSEPLYAFKHALTHEVAYSSMLRERRLTLHARIVDAIERRYADRLSDQIERLAHHAVRGEVWDKALGYLRQAGARAFAHSAHKLAVTWFEQALGVLDRLPDRRASREHAVDLRLDLRYALTPLGQFARIYEVLREAEQIAADLGDHRRLGIVTSFLTNYFQVFGDLDRAVEYGERARDIAMRHRDTAVEVVASSYLSLSYQTLGDLPRAIALARSNIAAIKDDLERFGMAILPSVYSRTALVRALADLGDFDEGAAVGADAIRIAEAANHAYSLHFACLGLGALYLRQGESMDAIRVLEQGRDVLEAAGARAMSPMVGGFLGSAYTLAGRAEDALRILARAREEASSIGFPASNIGSGVRLVALAEAHLASGAVDRAAELAPRALQVFERLKARGYQAWALKVLGAVAGAARPPRVEDAEAYCLRGRRLAEELGMIPLVAQCRLVLGELYRQVGQAVRAREELAGALQVFRTRRMGSWIARAEAELTKIP